MHNLINGSKPRHRKDSRLKVVLGKKVRVIKRKIVYTTQAKSISWKILYIPKWSETETRQRLTWFRCNSEVNLLVKWWTLIIKFIRASGHRHTTISGLYEFNQAIFLMISEVYKLYSLSRLPIKPSYTIRIMKKNCIKWKYWIKNKQKNLTIIWNDASGSRTKFKVREWKWETKRRRNKGKSLQILSANKHQKTLI